MMTIGEANVLIKQKISEVDEEMILGFLPLTESEGDDVIDAVVSDIRENGDRDIFSSLKYYPAATAYALAVAPAKTQIDDNGFYRAWEEDLSVFVSVNHRKELSKAFRKVCRNLGLKDGTLEKTAHKNIAPFKFQAGVFLDWKNVLTDGLKNTLKHYPAPDMEDGSSIKLFSKHLSKRIYGKKLLKYLLESDIGPFVVRRLMTAYLRQEWTVLPAYLQSPIKEAFSESGRAIYLQSPYLQFNSVFKQIELVLPRLNYRFTTEASVWRVEGRSYAARYKTVLSLAEMRQDVLEIQLKRLAGKFKDQVYSIDCSLNYQNPFRIFRSDTGREVHFARKGNIQLTPRSYSVLTDLGISAGEDEVETLEGFKLIEVDIAPGEPALELSSSDESWAIEALLRQGIYLKKDYSVPVQNSDAESLHYGDELGLVGYIPNDDDINEISLQVICDRQNIDVSQKLLIPYSEADASFIFIESLSAPILESIKTLPCGIHKLEIKIACSSRLTVHRIWYWQGLERISEVDGFVCKGDPFNVNYAKCKGLMYQNGCLKFMENYHAPFVTIALEDTRDWIEIPRAGVEVLLVNPENEHDDFVPNNKPLIVTGEDKRILKFNSGGFQCWSIQVNNQEIFKLDRKRRTQLISLAGVAQTGGGSGYIKAVDEHQNEIKLLAFSKPLTASSPKKETDHINHLDTWAFNISSAEIDEIGVRISDYSGSPIPNQSGIYSVVKRVHDDFITNPLVLEGGLVSIISRHIFADEAKGNPYGNTLKVRLSFPIDEIEDHLLAIDFYLKTGAQGDWIPLKCAERHGFSTLRIFAWGDRMPKNQSSWWPMLRRMRMEHRNASFEPLIASIDEDELREGLKCCRNFLDWKYPYEVWNTNAHRLEVFPVHLSRYRFGANDDSASIWWQQAIIEMSNYAKSAVSPVVRQFLAAVQPNVLRLSRSKIPFIQSESIVARSLNTVSMIHESGSLKGYLLAERDELNEELIPCFGNFIQVQLGTASDFKDFSLNDFLEGNDAGINGIKNPTIDFFESNPRITFIEKLFGPEHLLKCIRALNRRGRDLEKAIQSNEINPLSKIAQCIQEMDQEAELLSATLANKINWKTHESNCWIPPLLESELVKYFAVLAWNLAALSRLTAYGRLSEEKFYQYLLRLTASENFESPLVRKRLSMIISFAPELLSFYLGLFEFLFPEES